MRSGVMDHQDVADLRMRELPVNGEFVIVFAECADHIDGLHGRSFFPAGNGDVMVCPVHCRADQVRG